VDGWRKLRFKSLVLPGGLLLVITTALVRLGVVNISLSVVDLYYYSAFLVGLLLSWRFHSSRTFSVLLLLFLSQTAVEFFASGGAANAGPGLTALEAVSFLLPLNFALLAITQERGFALSTVAPRLLVLFVESVFVAMLCRPQPATGSSMFHGALLSRAWFSWSSIPQISWFAFALTMGTLVALYVMHHKAFESSFAWALGSFYLALNMGGARNVARAYVATSATILVVSIIEASYVMAYHDELTGLPSRRAFNDARLQLEGPYSVAVVDIDHFKKFNDTYGHETGDDVLCMVADRLARVTGGGQAFRVGGEEFSILFPDKRVDQTVEHLELLRATIATSVFRLRGSDRRANPRGPDRRKAANRKKKPSRARAALSSSALLELSVTVSIGVAEPDAKHASVERVIQLADKALYRAKDGGRNRVEIYTPPATRSKKKAATKLA
jgi:diguanylate cyclase (GGDEF)-like protein